MSTVTAPSFPIAIPAPVFVPGSPRLRRWTCAEFHELGDRGLFEGRRAMLIDGVILEEGPMNPPHATGVRKATKALERVFAAGFEVRAQLPLVLTGFTDPHPDVAVVLGTTEDYATQHPTTAVLLVEVSDTSVGYDQSDKASLYAAAGIADYWIINLVDRLVQVRRRPLPDSSQAYGHRYADETTFRPGATIAPLAAPQSQIAVADLLP